MSQHTVDVFVDGSYDKDNKVGVIGFLILKENGSFQPSGDHLLETATIQEANNTRVELRACIAAMDFVWALSETNQPKQKHVRMYTDCQTVVNLPARLQKLIRSEFKSQRTKRLLSNADLYRKFYFQYDRLLPEIHWVKGHTASNSRNHIQRQFRHIDKLIRKKLRIQCRKTRDAGT